MHQYNLKNLEHLDGYIKLLQSIEDSVFIHLNSIENRDRELRECDEWNDINHLQFTTTYIVEMQKLTIELSKIYYESIEELRRLREQYSQII